MKEETIENLIEIGIALSFWGFVLSILLLLIKLGVISVI